MAADVGGMSNPFRRLQHEQWAREARAALGQPEPAEPEPSPAPRKTSPRKAAPRRRLARKVSR